MSQQQKPSQSKTPSDDETGQKTDRPPEHKVKQLAACWGCIPTTLNTAELV